MISSFVCLFGNINIWRLNAFLYWKETVNYYVTNPNSDAMCIGEKSVGLIRIIFILSSYHISQLISPKFDVTLHFS